MASILVDPAEMRNFEQRLRAMKREMEERRKRLEAETREIRSFWNDRKYREFVKRQEELMLQIQVFTKMCDKYCTYLLKKAAAAEAYLGR